MKKILENLSWELALYSEIPGVSDVKAKVEEAIGGDVSVALEAVQGAERTLKIVKSWAHNDPALLQRLQNTKDRLWTEEPEAKIDKEKAHNLAKQFYESNQKAIWASTAFKISHIGKEVVEAIIKIFEEQWKSIDYIDVDEPYFHATLLEGTGEEWLNVIKDRRLEKFDNVVKLVNVRQTMPSDIQNIVSPEANILLNAFAKAWEQRLRSGELFYTLTSIPTPEEAKLDGMDYDAYVDLFFESCDQPRDEIGKAQELLIHKMDAAKQVRIWNQDGTDISVDIDGMTFANSLVLKNIPWSEAFSAAKKHGVNGKIVTKWNYKYRNSPIIKDPVMEIENGKIINAYAADEASTLAFNEILDTDEGARYFGEFAIGTNPHLRKQFLNPLLVEKVWGSFHMAAWQSYTYKTYDGKPVNLDNWNGSNIHWDITTMLRDQNSEIIVDGEAIQRNGLWLDPQLRVLNEWWGAVSEERQPKRWKEKYPQGYNQ